jgi:hypothetical protein
VSCCAAQPRHLPVVLSFSSGPNMSIAGRPAAMYRHARLRDDGRGERLVVCHNMVIGLLRWLVVQ